MALKATLGRVLNVKNCISSLKNYRCMSFYPVNDEIYGLTDEQKQVN